MWGLGLGEVSVLLGGLGSRWGLCSRWWVSVIAGSRCQWGLGLGEPSPLESRPRQCWHVSEGQ